MPKLVTQRGNSLYLLADQTVDARSPSLLEVERLRLFDIRIASSHIALLLFGDAAVVIGISIVGIEPDRFGEVGDRAIVVFLFPVCLAAVVKGNGAVGRKPDRLVEVGDGALVLAF